MKMLKSGYFRLISWMLIISFVFVYVFNDYTYASKYIAANTAVARMEPIQIPFEFGQVVETYMQGSSKSRVILIQDLHANYEVQKNIKGILTHIDNNYGIERVGTEGNSADVDVSLLYSIPDIRVKADVIHYFMKKGFVNGAEEFAAYKDPPILEGLDNEDFYRQDTQILLSSLNRRPEIVEYLERIKFLLKTAESSICSSDLQKFRSQYVQYKQDLISPYIFQKHLTGWAKIADKPVAGISEEYNRYMKLAQRQETIDFSKVEKEYRKLMKVMKLDYEGKPDISVTFKRFKEFFSSSGVMREKMSRLIFTDPAYSNLKNYIETVELSKELNTYSIVGEENKVVEEISCALGKNDNEKDFVFISNYIQLMVKFLLNQITRDELDRFYARAGEFEEKFNMLKIQYKKEFSAIDSALLMLKQHVQEMGSFYEIAKKRDLSFINKFEDSFSGTGNNLVMVTGGFHTYGVARELKNRNIPYTIIIPRVTSYTEEDMRLYYSLLRGEEVVSYEEMILQNLSLPTFLDRPWLARRIVARAVSSYVRAVLEKHGYKSAEISRLVSAFVGQWAAENAKAAGTVRFRFFIEEIIHRDRDKEIVFILNLSGEKKAIAVNSKGKLRVLSEEESGELEIELKRLDISKRISAARSDGKHAHLVSRDKLEIAATVSGLKPVTSVDADVKKAEIQGWLNGINSAADSKLGVFTAGGRQFLYDESAVLTAIKRTHAHTGESNFNMAAEADIAEYLEEFFSRPVQELEKDWRTDILLGFPVDKVVAARGGLADISVIIGKESRVEIGREDTRDWEEVYNETQPRITAFLGEAVTGAMGAVPDITRAPVSETAELPAELPETFEPEPVRPETREEVAEEAPSAPRAEVRRVIRKRFDAADLFSRYKYLIIGTVALVIVGAAAYMMAGVLSTAALTFGGITAAALTGITLFIIRRNSLQRAKRRFARAPIEEEAAVSPAVKAPIEPETPEVREVPEEPEVGEVPKATEAPEPAVEVKPEVIKERITDAELVAEQERDMLRAVPESELKKVLERMGQKGIKTGILVTRMGGIDGVALETEKWIKILKRAGAAVNLLIGEGFIKTKGIDKTHMNPGVSFSEPINELIIKLTFTELTSVKEVIAGLKGAFRSGILDDETVRLIRSAEEQILIDADSALSIGLPLNMAVMDKLRPLLNRIVEQLVEHQSSILERQIGDWIDTTGNRIVILENSSTIPMQIPLGVAVARVAEKRKDVTFINHNHDFWFERRRYQPENRLNDKIHDYLAHAFPLVGENIVQVFINSEANTQLYNRLMKRADDSRDRKDFERAEHYLREANRLLTIDNIAPNVMDFTESPPEIDVFNSDFRRRIGVEEDDFIIANVVRIVERKSIEYAIKNLKMQKDRYPDKADKTKMCLILTGGDESAEGTVYMDALKDYIKYLGMVVGKDVIMLDEFAGKGLKISQTRKESDDQGDKIYTLEDV
ncbi:MAG: hypothetical protein ABIH89_08740, partial [Elusimicrobiota bacterium]